MKYLVTFRGEMHPPVEVSPGRSLALELDASNSPLLFGCHEGVCGTCVVEVEGTGLPPADDEERELLDIVAPDSPGARLACQLDVRGDICILGRP